jgi:hypothetical protein
MLEAQGYYGEARALFRQSLTLSYVLDDKRSLSQTLEQIAGLISLDNEHEHAARLMGAAQALRDSIFAVVEPLDHPQHDRVIARLHANLDEAALAAHWAEGGLMTLEQAIECALSEG